MLALETLKAIVIEADVRARRYGADGRMEATLVTYETALRLLYTLLATEQGARRGWAAVAQRLTDQRQRLAIDALAASPLGIYESRATALFSLPPLQSVRTLRDVRGTITDAIAHGAPAYNDGNVRGCGILYWTTLQTLLAAPTETTLLGYARIRARLRPLGEAEPPASSLDDRGIDDFAWSLRRCFDAILDERGVESQPKAVVAAPRGVFISPNAPTEADG